MTETALNTEVSSTDLQIVTRRMLKISKHLTKPSPFQRTTLQLCCVLCFNDGVIVSKSHENI